MKDLYHNLKISQIIDPVKMTASTDSAVIDQKGFESLSVIVAVGNSLDTLSGSVKWTIKLQHSDASGSGYEDVTTTDLLNAEASIIIDAPAEDTLALKFGYKGSKRFIKAVITATGTHTNGTPIAVLALQGDASLAPAN